MIYKFHIGLTLIRNLICGLTKITEQPKKKSYDSQCKKIF